MAEQLQQQRPQAQPKLATALRKGTVVDTPAPDVDPASLDKAVGSVKVSCGVCFGPWQVAGKTVEFVRRHLATAYNIHPEAQAVINGEIAEETQVLKPGDELEFVKQSGQKG